MNVENSQTRLLERLKTGDLEAATPLWTAYFCRLMGLARQKLSGNPQRVADAEDVVLSAFHSFCKGVLDDRFQKLNDRNDLWQVLAMITTRKALRQVERERALKRGGGAVRGESVFLNADGSFIASGMSQVVTEGPTPDFQVAAEEQFNRLLDCLNQPLLRKIAMLRLEGHSNEDIAQQIGRNVRTVERKLNLIRSLWSEETGDDEP